MKNKVRRKAKGILHRIMLVFLALIASITLFIFAFSALLVNKPNALYAHLHLGIALIILIAVISIVVTSIIRKILKPLSVLTKAAKEVGKGNLDLTVPVTTNDELAELTTTFNQMTAELKKMIQAREHLLLAVSHELRTPVTRAKIALEMMPDSLQKESVCGDLKEMEIMITDILESERLKNGITHLNLLPVKIGKMLEKLLVNYLRSNNSIILFPVSDRLTICVDEAMITTVLRNLLDNSLKYSPSDHRPIEISVIEDNEKITIQIEDFGPGIPEDKLPFIFEPFYRVDQSRSRKTGGYGLGLHLCKRIMDSHKAEIIFKNKPNGTGLIISLCFAPLV